MNPGAKYKAIVKQVKDICRGMNRLDVPEIIAVSKKHQVIKEAIKSGIYLFGENKIQEAIEKFSPLKEEGLQFELHHIGPLQSGNLRKLFGLFSVTHGAGSISSLLELIKHAEKNKVMMKYFIQVNLTGEDSKSGMVKKDLLKFLPDLEKYKSEYCMPIGLMTIGPADQDIIRTRSVFRELKTIRDDFFPQGKLSMGMSGDYRIAIEEGSDFLRIGTAIFGERL